MDGDEGSGEKQDVALLLGFSQSGGQTRGCCQSPLAAGGRREDLFPGTRGLAGRLERDQAGPEECGITEGLGGGVGGWGAQGQVTAGPAGSRRSDFAP